MNDYRSSMDMKSQQAIQEKRQTIWMSSKVKNKENKKLKILLVMSGGLGATCPLCTPDNASYSNRLDSTSASPKKKSLLVLAIPLAMFARVFSTSLPSMSDSSSLTPGELIHVY